MLLAIDVGNSTIKFGTFEGPELKGRFAIPTKIEFTAGELRDVLANSVGNAPVDRVIVSSVVPEVDGVIAAACVDLYGQSPVFVDGSFDLGFSINYDPPLSVGTDRLVNAFAAGEKYGKPVIACSLGTATTIDVVTAENEYIGGAIAPGIGTMAAALHEKASKLPLIEIRVPDDVIGSSTVASMRAGIFYGYAGLVEGLLRRVLEDPRLAGAKKPLVVATGGFSGMVAPFVSAIDTVDDDLTLDGLRRLAGSY